MAAQPDGSAIPTSRGVERTLGRAVADLSPSPWDIYRFEFAFFDLHAQRWQLFQEGLGTGEGAGHRAQIESLLQSLRAAFAAIPRGTLFNPVAESRIAADRGTTRTLTLDKLVWKTFGTKGAAHWTRFVEELEKNARDDGLLDLPLPGASQQDERKLVDLLKEFSCWPDTVNSVGIATSSVPSQTACLLISLLPILRHWDIYGAIRQAWATTSPGPPSSLWQECGKMMEPFYCCRFSYHHDENESATLPNQRITAEAVLSDLAEPGLNPLNIARRECFAYVYKPEGEELIFYRINAFFQDAIQRAVAASTENEVESDLYYLAYPIFSGLGRRHFLHIYARPEQPNVSVRELFEAWRQLHAQLNWPELRNVLVDELEEIDLARLRDRVFKELENISKTKNVEKPDEKRDELAFRLVTNQLHLVYPIRCACHNGELGFYDEPASGKPEVESDRIRGFPWKELALPVSDLTNTVRCRGSMRPDLCSKAFIRGYDGLPIVWDDRPLVALGPVQRKIVDGRQHRLVQQEIEFARRVWEAHKATREQAFQRYTESWEVSRVKLTRWRDELIDALEAASGSYAERFKSTTVVERFMQTVGARPDKFFEPWFYLEHLPAGEPSEGAWLHAYQEIARGKLHEVISEFIETDAVQSILHSDEAEPDAPVDCGRLLDDVKRAWTRLDEMLQHVNISAPTRGALGAVVKHIEQFNLATVRTWSDLAPLKQQITTIRNDDLRYQMRDDEILATEKLRRYLLLDNNDHICFDDQLDLNVSDVAFGLGQQWKTSILDELRKISQDKTLYVTGVARVVGKSVRRKPYPTANVYETIFLIALPLPERDWQNLLANKPGVLSTFGKLVGRWGDTFLLKIKASSESIESYSLPNRIQIPNWPHADITRGALSLTRQYTGPYWTCYGLAVRRYKV